MKVSALSITVYYLRMWQCCCFPEQFLFFFLSGVRISFQIYYSIKNDVDQVLHKQCSVFCRFEF